MLQYVRTDNFFLDPIQYVFKKQTMSESALVACLLISLVPTAQLIALYVGIIFVVMQEPFSIGILNLTVVRYGIM